MSHCKTCKYWNQVSVLRGGQKGTGECRRFPPTPYPLPMHGGGIQVMNIYPNTDEKEKACGEYKESDESSMSSILGPRL